MRTVKRKSSRIYAYLKVKNISSIQQTFFKPTKIITSECEIESLCINCPELYCINFSSSEIESCKNAVIEEFPFSHISNVCPLGAITAEQDGPIIDNKKCIGCGLCVHRCPVGAIHVDVSEGKANISKSSESIYYCYSTELDTEEYRRTIKLFSKLDYKIDCRYITLRYNRYLIGALKSIAKSSNGFDNIFIRNILLQMGCPSKVPRIGDVNQRTDLMFEVQDYIGICEVDFNVAAVDLPRTILDSVAVIHSRYGIDKSKIIPCIIISEFPNRRTEFYELLEDIEKVVGLKIHVISLYAWLAMYWFKSTPLSIIRDGFYVDSDKTQILYEVDKLTCASHEAVSDNYLQATK